VHRQQEWHKTLSDAVIFVYIYGLHYAKTRAWKKILCVYVLLRRYTETVQHYNLEPTTNNNRM
jgi:hypothetical protein